MVPKLSSVTAVLLLLLVLSCEAFVIPSSLSTGIGVVKEVSSFLAVKHTNMKSVTRPTSTTLFQDSNDSNSSMMNRRSLMSNVVVAAGATALVSNQKTANAAVGTLPEYADTNAIVQGVTVQVADKSQLDAMKNFLELGFEAKVLRQFVSGSITNVYMGYGPEELSIPKDFNFGSSFAKYGGHACINIQYDSSATNVYYRKGDDAPGDNIAYLQLAVPQYKISQMVLEGANIIDAYGYLNCVSPSGLPIRGIIGINPDPIMFLAIQSINLSQSVEFYNQLGFVQQEYPYARPGKGTYQFEPLQPDGSIYMAPSVNSMGILLLPPTQPKEGFFSRSKTIKSVKSNPALQSLNIVYTPNETDADTTTTPAVIKPIPDPSQVPIALIPSAVFENLERSSRVPA